MNKNNCDHIYGVNYREVDEFMLFGDKTNPMCPEGTHDLVCDKNQLDDESLVFDYCPLCGEKLT